MGWERYIGPQIQNLTMWEGRVCFRKRLEYFRWEGDQLKHELNGGYESGEQALNIMPWVWFLPTDVGILSLFLSGVFLVLAVGTGAGSGPGVG